MRTGKAGLDLIKFFEGCSLRAYKDSVGVWTIGYGHTSAAGAPKVVSRLTISQDEAEAILARDLGKYEADVTRAVRVPLTQNQFDALVSWHYNTGAVGRATLTKKLNEGDYAAVPRELAKWNKAGGKVLKGLTRRRKAEADLWSSDAVPIPVPPPDVPWVDPAPDPVPWWKRLFRWDW